MDRLRTVIFSLRNEAPMNLKENKEGHTGWTGGRNAVTLQAQKLIYIHIHIY